MNIMQFIYTVTQSVKRCYTDRGQGHLPTATSVTADIVAACRNLLLGMNGKRLHAPQHERKVKSDSEMICSLLPPDFSER